MSGKYVEFIWLFLIVGAFWLLILRPARKRQRDAAAIQGTLTVGSRVMLTSGIFGTVTQINDESFDLEVAPGTTLEVLRQAVARVVTPAPEVTMDDDVDPEIVQDTRTDGEK